MKFRIFINENKIMWYLNFLFFLHIKDVRSRNMRGFAMKYSYKTILQVEMLKKIFSFAVPNEFSVKNWVKCVSKFVYVASLSIFDEKLAEIFFKMKVTVCSYEIKYIAVTFTDLEIYPRKSQLQTITPWTIILLKEKLDEILRLSNNY